jgi:hypothetical protein
MNAFFVCDMVPHVRERQPKVWIHGHSHDRCDYLLGKTRVVTNPHGYPNEIRPYRLLWGLGPISVTTRAKNSLNLKGL